MSLLVEDALHWLDRAEEGRMVAEQLTDPGAKKAVLQVAQSYERLARAAATRTTAPTRKIVDARLRIRAADGKRQPESERLRPMVPELDTDGSGSQPRPN